MLEIEQNSTIIYSIPKLVYLKIYIKLSKENCRGKGPRSYNGPWVPYKSLTTSEEKVWVPKGLPAQFLWAQKYLKGGPKRNVSSDVPNMAQTCTLLAIRIHSYEH